MKDLEIEIQKRVVTIKSRDKSCCISGVGVFADEGYTHAKMIEHTDGMFEAVITR